MNQTPFDQEMLESLQEDVRDYATEAKLASDRVIKAGKESEESTIRWAEAIIALNTYKQQHGL